MIEKKKKQKRPMYKPTLFLLTETVWEPVYGKQIRPLLNGLEFQLKEGAITDFMRPPDSGEESLTQSQIPEWLP